jgi:hypothetical protein
MFVHTICYNLDSLDFRYPTKDRTRRFAMAKLQKANRSQFIFQSLPNLLGKSCVSPTSKKICSKKGVHL